MPPSVTLGSDPPPPPKPTAAGAAGAGQPPQQQQQQESNNKDIPTIDLSCDENDDLQKAIALSLQDQSTTTTTTTIQGVSAEDQEVSRALEASLKDSRRPQATPGDEPLNPRERKRQLGIPVGLKNIGNSCWFNVIVQPLFHIPWFRKLIVNYPPQEEEESLVLLSSEDHRKSQNEGLFAPALRKLFALMLGSERKYVDPSAAVNIFQGREMMRRNAQQDVCEFTHKLLERLEEEYQVLLRRKDKEEKSSSECRHSKGGENNANFDNPMVKLFYGQSRKEATTSCCCCNDETKQETRKETSCCCDNETKQQETRKEPCCDDLEETKLRSRKEASCCCCDDDETKQHQEAKEETFGQYPLHVTNYVDIHDSILASMATHTPPPPSSMPGDNSTPPVVRQETWFKILPPVLIFSLSRYEYSHEKKRAEKVHNKFEFPEYLYMDRYMEENKKMVKEKHIKVAKLKSELNSLTKTLDKYQKYGTGQAKYPIGDILKYTLDFAQTGHRKETEAGNRTIWKQQGQETEEETGGFVSSPSSMMEVDGVEGCEMNDVEMTDDSLRKPLKEDSGTTENYKKIASSSKEDSLVTQNNDDIPIKEDVLLTEDNNTDNNSSSLGCTVERENDSSPEEEEEPHHHHQQQHKEIRSPSKRMRILPPIPRTISTKELCVLESCLNRWLQDVNAQVLELNRRIGELEDELHRVYDEPRLKRVPYRLHAVVVHEGQASGGHYWVYTFDTLRNTWTKFNDIQVVESNWEELLLDSVGGQNNASAYCLFYIDEAARHDLFSDPDKNMAGLPIDLQDYVKADNLDFLRELQEWDAKQQQQENNASTEHGKDTRETTTAASQQQQQLVPVTTPTTTATNSNSPPDIICIPETDENGFFFTEAETMLSQTIKDALSASNIMDYNSVNDPHEGSGSSLLNAVLCNEFCRLRSFAETENNPYSEPSILDFGVYLIRNKQQNAEPLLRWYGCEVVLQVTQNNNNINNEHTHTMKKLALEAGQYLQQMIQEQQQQEEYQGWLRHYRTLLECAWQLVLGHKFYERGNLERAMPHLLRACRAHRQLNEEPPHGNRKTLNKQVLWKCRQRCLLALNDRLIQRFWNGDDQQLQEIPGNVNSLVVPALAQMVEEDHIAEVVRNNWCKLLEKEIPEDEKRSQTRTQILLGVLTTSGSDNNTTTTMPPLQTPRHPSVLPLYKQYLEAFTKIARTALREKIFKIILCILFEEAEWILKPRHTDRHIQ
ncbi:hypothetical protein Pmani_028776 [Petrolisthes manimaculis]|uniref:USP domain-containing protein n=1 Tax=Petrolisthes manimaculis TaxID=1843537 RepID=A0AAE1NZF0_9EUCA|nr:hypothetical protein Pmani_028776 [Petrolisthes manimaculis]